MPMSLKPQATSMQGLRMRDIHAGGRFSRCYLVKLESITAPR